MWKLKGCPVCRGDTKEDDEGWDACLQCGRSFPPTPAQFHVWPQRYKRPVVVEYLEAGDGP